MPKTEKHLFENTFTLENMLAAFRTARQRKNFKPKVYGYRQNPLLLIEQLLEEINNDQYELRPYTDFMVYDPKPREISAPDFRDVVVQHANYNKIYPIFDNTFIFDSYGCRREKGTHKCSDRAQEFLRSTPDDRYILQTDISKFYASIDRSILKDLLARKIRDRRYLNLLVAFTNFKGTTSVPIGSLLSQLYALIYLNELDQYVKHTLKIKKYVRYVDDCVFFDLTRSQVDDVLGLVVDFLDQNLNLKLSHYSSFLSTKELDFVGYRTTKKTRVIRHRSLRKFRHALQHGNIDTIQSILGHARHSASYRTMVREIYDMNPSLLDYLSIEDFAKI